MPSLRSCCTAAASLPSAVQIAGPLGTSAGAKRPALALLTEPRHPYTIALLKGRTQGAMKKGARLETIAGSPPDLSNLPAGCAFAPRCAYAKDACVAAQPEERRVGAAHSARCIRVDEIASLGSTPIFNKASV